MTVPAAGSEQGGVKHKGQGDGEEQLSHSTWHPPAPAAPGGIFSVPEAGSRSLHNSPERPVRPGASAKRSGFNMKGLLKSVSTHSFSRRTEAAAGSTPSRKASELETKGWFLEKQGKLDQAELMYSRHCLRSQKHHGKESLSLANNLDRLVHLLHKEGKLEEAEPLSRRSLDIRRKSLGEDNEEVATAMVNLGRVLEEKGQYTDALFHLRKGLAIREKVLEEGHPDTVSALAWIGDIHSKREEYGEALEIAKKVAKAHEAKLGPDDIKVASSLNNVAGLLASTGQTDAALPLFTRSHEIYVKHLGEQHPHSVATQLWVQQLSAPPPPVRRRCRGSMNGGAYTANRLSSPPPPLMEVSSEGGEDDVSGGVGIGGVGVGVGVVVVSPLPEELPVCF